MNDSLCVNVGILEDEAKFVDIYKDYLKKWNCSIRDYSLDVFIAGTDLIRAISQKKYDILFIDIVLQRENESGIVIANDLRKLGYNNLIVFVTRFSDYWPKGYDVSAFRYYIKPLQYDDFTLCMEHALKKKLGKYFKYSFKEERKIIPYDDIYYFSVQGHYATIHMHNKEYKMLDTMNNLKITAPGNFVQCHRSFLVNLDHVNLFTENKLVMDTGITLYISQTYLHNVRSEFVRWVR